MTPTSAPARADGPPRPFSENARKRAHCGVSRPQFRRELDYPRERRVTTASTAGAAHLAGDLRDVQLPELLWRLHESGRSGCLEVRRDGAVKQLWLTQGKPVFARSNQRADRLTDRLLARGLLSRAQYDAAQALIAGRGGKRIGEVLVDAGLISARELHEALAEHLLRMLDSMFLWTDGEWRFEDGATCSEPVVLDVPTAAILMAGARHRIPLRRLWEVVGDSLQRPRLRPGDLDEPGRAALALELRLEPSEAAWLAELRGARSLAAMLEDFDADEHELLSLIYTLKMIRRLEPDAGRRPAP